MLALDEADWAWIGAHFARRLKVHHTLKQYHRDGARLKFAELAVGDSDPIANCSASDFGLGPMILDLNRNAVDRIFELAGKMLALNTPAELPQIVAQADLYSMKIGVGSELACMLRPSLCWVANTKSLWSYLFDYCDGNMREAREMMHSYNEVGIATIYPHMEGSMVRVSERQPDRGVSSLAGVRGYRYLWADAICCRAFERNF
ncbi:hypothetical protein SAMN05421770_10111 [Granulicella rosea]|uniref:Uncharacterized protein n=1 Tax=Granulicella rosea TaxID=474952 RepID=A0A239CPG1_9BACT|nr:hypothetical protein [Granulicella rosea]SNS21384.1 hypothetical protein SAMN05421770_10111 [Granulicella rosea]